MSLNRYKKQEPKAVAVEEPAKKAAPSKKSSLEDKLKELGLDYARFKNSDEGYRKRALKENYSAVKAEYGWVYDQPVE